MAQLAITSVHNDVTHAHTVTSRQALFANTIQLIDTMNTRGYTGSDVSIIFII